MGLIGVGDVGADFDELSSGGGCGEVGAEMEPVEQIGSGCVVVKKLGSEKENQLLDSEIKISNK